MHCHHVRVPQSRREMLAQCATGFGGMALAALVGDRAFGATPVSPAPASPFAPRPTHFPAKAKSIIFLYMDGGVSQVDSFDPKPRLTAENGQPFKMKMEPTQFNNNGSTLASPWNFKQYGQCGAWVSDLFPHIAECVDDMAFVRSMTSNFSEHTAANYFLHTGSGVQGRPSMGAWALYGLGSECQNLPGYVVLNGGLIPRGGLDNFYAGFLPAAFQGSIFRRGSEPLANVRCADASTDLQQHKLAAMRALDEKVRERWQAGDPLESAVANYELAFRMQSAVPEVADLSSETKQTEELYGLDDPKTEAYGRQCLLARRLVERGVRFIELTCHSVGADRWDQHAGLKKGHQDNARATDKPIAGLLKDLKARGLLDQTLVLWSGEFGRTPFAQGSDGRDHNPFAYTVWMAGGGARGGVTYGASDEYGYKVVEGKASMHDLHATILHLAGIDHKRLTYRWGGRDMRLTDVHGELLEKVIA
jgi:hypothetical protein